MPSVRTSHCLAGLARRGALPLLLAAAACGRAESSGDHPPGDLDGSSGGATTGGIASGGTSPGAAPSGGASNGGSGGAGGTSTGGASTGGASTGGALNLPAIETLSGDYDIDWGTPPLIPDCRPLFTEQHLNFHLAFGDAVSFVETEAELFRDFWVYDREATYVYDGGELRLDALEDTVPPVTLSVDESGFTSAATVTIPYDCEGQPLDVLVSATVVPDQTPPKLRVHTNVPGASVFSFSLVSFDFSEPLFTPTWEILAYKFWDAGHVGGLVTVADQNGPVPHTWNDDSGGRYGILFDRDTIGGDTVTFSVDSAVRDRAGHSAVITPNPVTVLDAGPVLTTTFDLDAGPPPGLYGDATYLASGPLCESGGCIVLEGLAPPCDEYTQSPSPNPAVYGLRVDHGPETSKALFVRYRLWSSAPDAPHPFVKTDASSGYEPFDVPLSTEALDYPFTHAGDWQDLWIPPMASFNYSDAGTVIGIGCASVEPRPMVRLVIDRGWMQATGL